MPEYSTTNHSRQLLLDTKVHTGVVKHRGKSNHLFIGKDELTLAADDVYYHKHFSVEAVFQEIEKKEDKPEEQTAETSSQSTSLVTPPHSPTIASLTTPASASSNVSTPLSSSVSTVNELSVTPCIHWYTEDNSGRIKNDGRGGGVDSDGNRLVRVEERKEDLPASLQLLLSSQSPYHYLQSAAQHQQQQHINTADMTQEERDAALARALQQQYDDENNQILRQSRSGHRSSSRRHRSRTHHSSSQSVNTTPQTSAPALATTAPHTHSSSSSSASRSSRHRATTDPINSQPQPQLQQHEQSGNEASSVLETPSESAESYDVTEITAVIRDGDSVVLHGSDIEANTDAQVMTDEEIARSLQQQFDEESRQQNLNQMASAQGQLDPDQLSYDHYLELEQWLGSRQQHSLRHGATQDVINLLPSFICEAGSKYLTEECQVRNAIAFCYLK